MNDSTDVSILKLQGTDTFIIKKGPNSNFFITTPDSIIISQKAFSALLQFLVTNKMLHPSYILGLLEELNTE